MLQQMSSINSSVTTDVETKRPQKRHQFHVVFSWLLALFILCLLGIFNYYTEKKRPDKDYCFVNLPGEWQVFENVGPNRWKPDFRPVDGCRIELHSDGDFVMHNCNRLGSTINGTITFSTNHITGTWSYWYDFEKTYGLLEFRHESDEIQGGFNIGCMWDAWGGNQKYFDFVGKTFLMKTSDCQEETF